MGRRILIEILKWLLGKAISNYLFGDENLQKRYNELKIQKNHIQNKISSGKSDNENIAIEQPSSLNPNTGIKSVLPPQKSAVDKIIKTDNKQLEEISKSDSNSNLENKNLPFIRVDDLFPTIDETFHTRNVKSRISSLTTEQYLEINKSNQEIGYAGELFVLKYERELLLAIGKAKLAEEIKHASKEIGDGLGYDIISYDENGNPKYIEVKTTTQDYISDFFLSLELNKMRLTDNYFIYRVFDFNITTGRGSIYIISR